MILLGGTKVAYIDVLVQEESGGGGFVWKPTRTDLITARSAHGVVSLPGADTLLINTPLLILLLYLYYCTRCCLTSRYSYFYIYILKLLYLHFRTLPIVTAIKGHPGGGGGGKGEKRALQPPTDPYAGMTYVYNNFLCK